MSDTITINDGAGNVTYTQLSLTSKEGLYRDVTSSLSNPRICRVSHETAKSNDGSDRHLVQFTRTDDDADGNPYMGSVHIVISAPREGVSQSDLQAELTKLTNLVTAKFSDIVGGFQPTD